MTRIVSGREWRARAEAAEAESVQLLEQVEVAESVAQMAARDRDEALVQVADADQEYGLVRGALALIVGAFTNGVYCGSCGDPVDDCDCVINTGRNALR